MAVNDIFSSPKRFGIMVLVYVLCLSLVLIMVNTASTLRSSDLIYSMGLYESDVFYTDQEAIMRLISEDGRELAEDYIAEIEDVLEENGISGKCTIDMQFKLTVSKGDKSCKSLTSLGVGTTCDMYRYIEGTAPQSANEVALTSFIAEKIGAEIGDTVTISSLEGDREFIVTALYQSMNNMGEGIRLHEDVEISFAQASGMFPYQITFDGNPDKETVLERIEQLKDIFDTDEIKTASVMIDEYIGVAYTIDAVKLLILMVTIIVVMLVTVLMERSFITKEQNEIALCKAIGFKTGSIVGWHAMRFIIVGLISTSISLIIAQPVTELTVGPIFSMMGATYGVRYEINPLEVYIIYPAIVLAVTTISAWLTAMYTRHIPASKVSGIE